MNRTYFRALAALAIAVPGAPALAAPPSTSAYVTDPQESHVEDATSRGIGQVNMITCIMSAMRPDALVNDGPYVAMVDMQKCDPNARASTDNAGGATGASSYATATVNSTRASNADPMRARIWIDDPESEGAQINVNLSATAPPTASNPYGQFRLDYCGNMAGTPGCAFNGFLEGAAGGVSYYEREQGDGGGGTKALRMTTTSTTTGSGSLHMEDGGNNSATFSFAYNADYYRRSDDNGEQCFARDARDPGTGMSVWRYGLYDATTGARIERNSGFPIEYTHAGTTYQGFLGYYGLSLPAAAQDALVNGDTVDKVDYGNGNTPTRTPYTVLKAGGKLMKYTRHVRTLHEIDQIKFTTWIGMEASSFFAGAQANTQYELYWDDAAGNFKVTGQMNCGPSGCNSQTLPTVQSVSASFWASRGGIQGWSQQLGGELFVNLQGVGTPVDASAVQVAYRSQDLVYPSQLPATLHCLRDCPTAASMSAYFSPGSQSPSPFVAATANNFQPTLAAGIVDYTSEAATALLLDGASAPVVMNASRDALDGSQFRSGVRTGKLFANLPDAECDVGSGTYCEWRINSLDVYYQWETGVQAFNQFAAVKDANGQFVNFDAPLQVNFAVPQGTAYGQYAGQNIVLQYGGFGDLWGVPGVCVSPTTNQEVACDGGEVRYVPSFVIPHDTTQGVVTTNGTTYYVKWLDREIRFARKNLAVCDAAGLTVPAGTTLPTAQDLRDPSDPASPIYIGTRPSVTAAPRVIQGEVKY